MEGIKNGLDETPEVHIHHQVSIDGLQPNLENVDFVNLMGYNICEREQRKGSAQVYVRSRQGLLKTRPGDGGQGGKGMSRDGIKSASVPTNSCVDL